MRRKPFHRTDDALHGGVGSEEPEYSRWSTGIADVDVDAIFCGNLGVVTPLLKWSCNCADYIICACNCRFERGGRNNTGGRVCGSYNAFDAVLHMRETFLIDIAQDNGCIGES